MKYVTIKALAVLLFTGFSLLQAMEWECPLDMKIQHLKNISMQRYVAQRERELECALKNIAGVIRWHEPSILCNTSVNYTESTHKSICKYGVLSFKNKIEVLNEKHKKFKHNNIRLLLFQQASDLLRLDTANTYVELHPIARIIIKLFDRQLYYVMNIQDMALDS